MLFRTPKPATESGPPALDKADSKAATAPSQGSTFGGDPLTASLTYLAAYHGRAVSPEALLGGLPILDGKLTVALYDRAARRAGLETEAIKRDLVDIPALVLPAVLIMKNGTALILLGIDRSEQERQGTRSTGNARRAARSCRSRRSRRNIPATPFSSGRRPKPMRAPSPQAIFRETTGFGRSSRCTGAATGTSRLPRS